MAASPLYKLYPLTGSARALRWSDLDHLIATAPDIPELLKAEGQAALHFLQQELGTGFFNTCGPNHPLRQKLMTAAGEGQLRALIAWVQVLQDLKNSASNYPFLLQKLQSKERSRNEAIPFLEIASRHLKNGFTVYFPEEKPDTKNPDIELTYQKSGEKIFAEVCRISEGPDREKQDKFYFGLVNLIHQYGYDLPFAGKLHQLPPEEEWAPVIARVKTLKDQAAEKGTLAAHRDEFLSIAFVTEDHRAELDGWCNQYNLPRRFDGLHVTYDYTSRISRQQRIHDKAKQIPPGQPGILYFPVPILYMHTLDKAKTMATFAAELERYPHIIGVVLYGEAIQAMTAPLIIDDALFTYAIQQNEAFVARYTLLVKNPAFDLSVSREAREALHQSAS